MESQRKLHIDLAHSISQLSALTKNFELKKKLYQTLLRGRGLDFEGYRTYSPEDDASLIDWKASRRTNNLMIREYQDERNLKIFFLIDVGTNMILGSREKLKAEYAVEVVAAFSNLIMNSGDKAGFILFNSEARKFLKPSRGRLHFAEFLDEVTNPQIYKSQFDLEKALEFIELHISPSINSLVIISDFSSFTVRKKSLLELIGKKFETLAIAVRDPPDYTLPDFNGEVVIEDPRTGHQLLINPKLAKRAYEHFIQKKQEDLKNIFRENGIDLLELSTDKEFASSLFQFITTRVKI